MAKSAAKISILLEAQTASLKQGFDEAKGAINDLDSNMSRNVAMGMAKFQAALALVKVAVEAVRFAIRQLNESLAELDSQQKTADKIGMSADALAALNRAATLAGESAEVVNDAMMRMTKSISEAAERGAGPASKALEELGLSAKALNDMTAEAKLGAIADAMQGVANKNDKMRIAMELFGRQGHVFVNMLSEGSEGLNNMAEQSGRLGSALGEKRKLVEDANDAISDMWKAWNSISDQFAISLAPILESVADLIKELGIITRRAVELTMPVIDLFVRTLAWLPKQIARGLEWLNIGGTGESTVFSGGLKAAKDAVTELSGELDAAAKEAEEAAARAAEEMAKRGEAMTKSLRTPVEIFEDQMAELNELVRAGAIEWGTYERGVRRAVEVLNKGKDAADWSTPSIGAMLRGSSDAFSAVQKNQRDKADDDRKHKEISTKLSRIEAAIRSSTIELAPVHL